MRWSRASRGSIASCARWRRGSPACGPATRAADARARLDGGRERLARALLVRLRHARAAVAGQQSTLAALSPLACLERGYAIVRQGDADGPVVRDAAALGTGEALMLLFARGRARARVEETEPGHE